MTEIRCHAPEWHDEHPWCEADTPMLWCRGRWRLAFLAYRWVRFYLRRVGRWLGLPV
jgi:hypothetical protein